MSGIPQDATQLTRGGTITRAARRSLALQLCTTWPGSPPQPSAGREEWRSRTFVQSIIAYPLGVCQECSGKFVKANSPNTLRAAASYAFAASSWLTNVPMYNCAHHFPFRRLNETPLYPERQSRLTCELALFCVAVQRLRLALRLSSVFRLAWSIISPGPASIMNLDMDVILPFTRP